MKKTNEIQAIQFAISRHEALGAARLQVMELVKDQLDAIGKETKEAREAVKACLSALRDVKLATNTANLIAPVLPHASEADRKRLSRRRNFLKNILSSAFPAYDFEVLKGRSGGGISCLYVGDADVRKANAQYEAVLDVFALLGEKLPKAITKEAILAKLKDGVVLVDTADFGPAAEPVAIDWQGIAAKVVNLHQASKENKEALVAVN